MSQLSFDDVALEQAADALYVIGEGDGCSVVKIGRARDPRKRLGSIQTGNPRRLHILHVELEAGPLEQEVHNRLLSRQLTGEWFDLSPLEPVAEVLRILEVIRNPPARPARAAEPARALPVPAEVLTPDDAAWELSVTTMELAKWRSDGAGPPFHLEDGTISYRRGDLEQWTALLLPEQRVKAVA